MPYAILVIRCDCTAGLNPQPWSRCRYIDGSISNHPIRPRYTRRFVLRATKSSPAITLTLWCLCAPPASPLSQNPVVFEQGVMVASSSNSMGTLWAAKTNVRQLEAVWKHAYDGRISWESELIHFNKGRKQWTDSLNLAQPGRSTNRAGPTESARLLGI